MEHLPSSISPCKTDFASCGQWWCCHSIHVFHVGYAVLLPGSIEMAAVAEELLTQISRRKKTVYRVIRDMKSVAMHG